MTGSPSPLKGVVIAVVGVCLFVGGIVLLIAPGWQPAWTTPWMLPVATCITLFYLSGCLYKQSDRIHLFFHPRVDEEAVFICFFICLVLAVLVMVIGACSFFGLHAAVPAGTWEATVLRILVDVIIGLGLVALMAGGVILTVVTKETNENKSAYS